LSNGTVSIYHQAINRINQHPVSRRKLKTVISGHLQQFMDIPQSLKNQGNLRQLVDKPQLGHTFHVLF